MPAKFLLLLGLLGFGSVVALAGDAPATIPIRLVTAAGTIEVELDAAHAPRTVANFLRYVDAGRYNGGRFHRTVRVHPDNQPGNAVKIEVIQGGEDPLVALDDWPPIALERTSLTGLKHLDGTISMARGGPDTARAEFFLCVGDQPELDFGGRRNPDGQGFAAFGRVTKGREIVCQIQAAPAAGQALTPPVRIERIERRP